MTLVAQTRSRSANRMKAEHRKELETNVLADWLGRRLETLKKGSKNSYLITGAIVLIAVVVFGYLYFDRKSKTSSSSLWYKYDTASSLEELDKLAADNRGTMAARAARFEVARSLMAQGVQNLANPDQHASALDSLEKARGMYDELAPLAKDTPILQKEALLGVATAEESLLGSDKGATLDRAQEYYQRVADAFPDTDEGKAARKRAEELANPKTRAEIEKFYVALNRRFAKTSTDLK
jgi:hypothetical protein